jgi:hypothetical protein
VEAIAHSEGMKDLKFTNRTGVPLYESASIAGVDDYATDSSNEDQDLKPNEPDNQGPTDNPIKQDPPSE